MVCGSSLLCASSATITTHASCQPARVVLRVNIRSNDVSVIHPSPSTGITANYIPSCNVSPPLHTRVYVWQVVPYILGISQFHHHPESGLLPNTKTLSFRIAQGQSHGLRFY